MELNSYGADDLNRVFASVKSTFSHDMAHMSRDARKPVFSVSDQF